MPYTGDVQITLEQVLRTIVRALEVGEEALDFDSGLGDIPEWDSLGHLAILQALDETFGPISSDVPELGDAESVRQIFAALARHQELD
jgi:acyl carrier protein